MAILLIFLTLICAVGIISPRMVWKIKNSGQAGSIAEPRVLDLIFIRITCILLIILGGTIFFISENGNSSVNSWSGTMLSNNQHANSWSISANTVNGNSRRNIKLSDNLNALYVENTNSDGTVLLKLTQGDNAKTIDLTGVFNKNIDMSDFEPESVRIHIYFNQAANVQLKINW